MDINKLLTKDCPFCGKEMTLESNVTNEPGFGEMGGVWLVHVIPNDDCFLKDMEIELDDGETYEQWVEKFNTRHYEKVLSDYAKLISGTDICLMEIENF